MKIMYHATPMHLWDSLIKIYGLVPQPLHEHVQQVTGLQNGLYLDSDLKNAEAWAGLSLRDIPENAEFFSVVYAILEVKIPDDAVLIPDPEVVELDDESTAFIVDVSVPPNDIRKVSESEIEWG